MNWLRTFSFGLIQITSGALISFWCKMCSLRFSAFAEGQPAPRISEFYWSHSWTYIFIAGVLFAIAVVGQKAAKLALYEIVIQFGYWLLLVWFGFALIAMEMAYVPDVHLHGA